MKCLLWKSVFMYIEIGTNYHNQNFTLRLALKERLRGLRNGLLDLCSVVLLQISCPALYTHLRSWTKVSTSTGIPSVWWHQLVAACSSGPHSQICHGNLPTMLHIFMGPPPTFDGTSPQAHLLGSRLTILYCNDIMIIQILPFAVFTIIMLSSP